MEAFLGVLLAITAAFGVAATTLCIRQGTEQGQSSAAIVVILVTNVFILVTAALLVQYPDYQITMQSLLAFGGAGITGTLIGRSFHYTGISRIGASRAESIKASQPIFAAVIALVILGEALSPVQILGIHVIVAGLMLISWESSDPDGSFFSSDNWFDYSLPFVAAFFYSIEPTLANIGIAEGTPIVVGLAVKTVTAAVGFILYLRWRNDLTQIRNLDTSSARWFVLAGIANSVFLGAYYASLELLPVAVVVSITQTSPLLVLGASYLFLQRIERVTWKLLVAAAVVVLGAVIVTI